MTRPHSLQGRLLALVLGFVITAWLVTAVITYLDVRHELGELLDGHLAQAAALLIVQQTGEIEDDHGVDAPTLHRYAPKVAFQVFHEGRLVSRSANAPAAPMIAPQEHFQTGFKTEVIDQATWRVFAAYGAEGDVQVYVGEQVSSRNAILWAVLRSSLWPAVAALPLLALAAWWAVRRGVTPLRRLGDTLRERKAETLHPVSAENAPAEMLPMIEALNDLFARIESLMESERRFTADAAHELRTPIAAIRAQAQVALAEPDAARRAHALAATLAGCDRATRLVEQLLTLARLEAGAAPDLTEVELRAIVRQVAAEIAPLADQKQQHLEVDAAQTHGVRGDTPLLAALIRNLVDNAVRYSQAGGRVKITLGEDASAVSLTVEDSGPGLSEAEIKRLGERFFRALGTERSGSGLGWSIVKRIASVHQAHLEVARSNALGGLSVRVRLPLPQRTS
jgi:two-component system sensor histidine kinase QseC